MTYEQLMQPQKALEIYNHIVSRQTDLGTNATPSLASIAEMARWRVGFIQWRDTAEAVNRRFADTNAIVAATTAKLLSNHE